ncbi:MAG: hypothetical protein BGN86_09225 [Caulobacterales bacterium 68-7]|nr:MAG: hypothetical protein BGN86_09225 [Caulobacterales bacterium 68-7]
MAKKDMIERAYELADTGQFTKAADICRQLSKEGYSGTYVLLHGAAFRGEIRKRIRFARTAAALAAPDGPLRH